MPRPDILIIDDDPLVREIARDLLSEQGYTVQVITEAREAVASVKTLMPKLVITDIMMPGVSGLDICKTITSDPDLADIRVIVMSAKTFEVEQRRALWLGAVLFLKKPFDAKTFTQTVKNIMAGIP